MDDAGLQSTFFRVPKDPLLAHAHGVDLTELAFWARRTRRQTCLFSASRLSWRVAPTHSQTAKALKSSQLTHSPPTRTPLSCCTWHGARTHTHSQVRPPLLPKRQRNATQRNTHRSAAAVERLWPHAFFFSSRLSLYESQSQAAARLALPTHTHSHPHRQPLGSSARPSFLRQPPLCSSCHRPLVSLFSNTIKHFPVENICALAGADPLVVSPPPSPLLRRTSHACVLVVRRLLLTRRSCISLPFVLCPSGAQRFADHHVSCKLPLSPSQQLQCRPAALPCNQAGVCHHVGLPQSV